MLILLQDFDCRNHIRVIQAMGDGNRLYVCGTNAHHPKDWVINVSDFLFSIASTIYEIERWRKGNKYAHVTYNVYMLR